MGEKGACKGAALAGCVKQMATYKFLYLTDFLADAVGILAMLSKTMQHSELSYHSTMKKIESSIVSLEALKRTDGPHLRKFKAELPTLETPDFLYKGHDIKYNAKEMKTAEDTSLKFLN